MSPSSAALAGIGLPLCSHVAVAVPDPSWMRPTLHGCLGVIPYQLLCNGAAPDGHVRLQSQQLPPDALLYEVSGGCQG